MKKLVYIFMLLCTTLVAQEGSNFEQANRAYDKGNYEAAVTHYSSILESGQTSVAVHYNLGNAYYRLNDVANSIYHYEKALQLDPTDQDVKNNLQFAQNMRIDEIEEVTPSEFQQWRNGLMDTFGTDGWASLGIIAMFGFSLLFLLYYFNRNSLHKRIFFVSSLAFMFLGIGAVSMGFTKKSFQQNNEFSIVLADQIEIKSEPNTRSSEVFTLHAGTKVEVLEQHQEWSKIVIGSGAQGWVQQDHLKSL